MKKDPVDRIARKYHQMSLWLMTAKFYLTATVIRMLAALAVATVGIILLKDKHESTGFAIIFIIFYLSMLVFDTIFFSRVEKKGLNK